MKLACIYNIWDGTEILRGSMLSVKERVDIFILVIQNVSNYGEYYTPLSDVDLSGFNYEIKFFNPQIGHGAHNEKAKRNIGIQAARDLGCTHFLCMDCDEYYENFDKAVNEYLDSGKEGSVCKMYTYFKKPTLRFENFDNYYVPFIHKLKADTVSGHPIYPYYVDPTRKINCEDVALINEPMHHFSYVRKDIIRKCSNSSAKANIQKSQLLTDYYDEDIGPGFFVKDFNQKLIEVENIFNIKL